MKRDVFATELSAPIHIGFIENDKRFKKKIQELDRHLRDERAHHPFQVRLEISPSHTIKPRWDAVVVDLSLTRKDEDAMTDWVLSWCNKASSGRRAPLPSRLSGLKALDRALKGDLKAACFTKAGFADVARIIAQKGILYYPKPKALTTQAVNMADRRRINILLKSSRKALSDEWPDIRPGIETLIQNLADGVVRRRLAAFWPLNLHEALAQEELIGVRTVPKGSYAVLIDLAGSSRKMSKGNIFEYWNALNNLLKPLYEIIKESGWIESFLGDGVLVQFNTFSKIANSGTAGCKAPVVFRKQIMPFLRKAAGLGRWVPRGTKLRILGTYLDPSHSLVGTLGESRFHLATISDAINTCAHVMKRVLDGSGPNDPHAKFLKTFFGKSKIRIGFFDPNETLSQEIKRRRVKKDWDVQRLDEELTKAYLQNESLEDGCFYLFRPRRNTSRSK